MIELDALRTRPAYRGLPMRPDGVYDFPTRSIVPTAQASLAGGNDLLKDAATGTEELAPARWAMIRFTELPTGAQDRACDLAVRAMGDHRIDRPTK